LDPDPNGIRHKLVYEETGGGCGAVLSILKPQGHMAAEHSTAEHRAAQGSTAQGSTSQHKTAQLCRMCIVS
jgi:hypothetical protein